MNKRILRWLTIIIPVGFMVIIFLTLKIIFSEYFQLDQFLVIFIAFSVGVVIFSNWVFGIIDQRELQINQYAVQLKALNQASLLITTELELAVVLQKVVDISRELIPSELGAIGVLNESGLYYEQFIPTGLDGVGESFSAKLGEDVFELIENPAQSICEDEDDFSLLSKEFQAEYPEIRSVLGVPLISKGKVIGNLFLVNRITEKDSKCSYSEEDQQVLEMFANQTAIVIENARLYRQTRQLAILQERERFGMDLHDGVIQSIYAVGLMLEDIQTRVSAEPVKAKQGISIAVASLNNAISDLRNYILNLRPHHFQGKNLIEGVEELARALRANTFMNVHVEMDKLDVSLISSDITSEILHITQEALSNVQKHARASDVEIKAKIKDEKLYYKIIDNGISIPLYMVKNPKGNGLNNMRERAEILNGKIRIRQIDSGGTEIRLKLPIKRSK